MKKLFLLLFIPLALSGCSTYYFTTVKPYNAPNQINKDGSYTSVSENKIEVTYSFRNRNGNIVFDINNQSDDPLFVDWNRSSLIIEHHAANIKKNQSPLPQNIPFTIYQFGDVNAPVVTDNRTGRVVLPQDDLFIPPYTKASYSPMSLSRVMNEKIVPDSLYSKKMIGESTVKYIDFSEENTPLMFRSYLTIVNDRNETQTIFEDYFYVAGIIRSGSANILFMNDVRNRGDIFFFEVENKTATTIGWVVAGVAVVGGMVLLAPYASEESTTFDYY